MLLFNELIGVLDSRWDFWFKFTLKLWLTIKNTIADYEVLTETSQNIIELSRLIWWESKNVNVYSGE